MPLTLFEQARQEIGMLIMDHKEHIGNDLNGFIVLSQIAFNWIMDIMEEAGVVENAEHGASFLNNQIEPINYTKKA